MAGGGSAWQGACMAGGVGGLYGGEGCAWQGRGMHSRGTCLAGQTATAADGRHPTGMHSCYSILFLINMKDEG